MASGELSRLLEDGWRSEIVSTKGPTTCELEFDDGSVSDRRLCTSLVSCDRAIYVECLNGVSRWVGVEEGGVWTGETGLPIINAVWLRVGVAMTGVNLANTVSLTCRLAISA